MDGSYQDRLRRLRAARATGHVPADLIPWLIDAVTEADLSGSDAELSPADRLGLQISTEIDRWMGRRGVTHRNFSSSRRTLARALKGNSLTTASLSDLADALGCDVHVEFRPRAGAALAPRAAEMAPSPCRSARLPAR